MRLIAVVCQRFQQGDLKMKETIQKTKPGVSGHG